MEVRSRRLTANHKPRPVVLKAPEKHELLTSTCRAGRTHASRIANNVIRRAAKVIRVLRDTGPFDIQDLVLSWLELKENDQPLSCDRPPEALIILLASGMPGEQSGERGVAEGLAVEGE